MMSLSKLSAGDGFRYLFDQTVSADRRRGRGQSLEEYYLKSGCPDGVWTGRGVAALGVGGAVSESQMAALFGEGLHPDADRIIAATIAGGTPASQAISRARLGRPFYQFQAENGRLAGAFRYELKHARAVLGRPLDGGERQMAARRAAHRFLADRSHNSTEATRNTGRQPVAGFDLTFSVPKSFSVAWACGSPDVQDMIERWHEAAIGEALDYVQDRAVFTRRGPDGVATLDTDGLVAARFRHWDSRTGDPQLHDHVAVANRVLGQDGKWRTLDGATLHRWVVAASEVYNRALADQVHAAGFATRLRDPGSHGQPVVELAGVDDAQIAVFSSRRAAIRARTDVLVKNYVGVHGHEPPRSVMYRLRQQATLETRAAKKGPQRLDDLRRQWQGRMATPVRLVRQNSGQVMSVDVAEVARATVSVVARQRATWNRHHIEAAVNRWACQQPLPVTGDDRAAIIRAAIDDYSLATTPAVTAPVGGGHARRKDGTSVYVKPDHEVYTCGPVLEAEDRLLAAADELTVPAIGARHIAEALAGAPAWMDADGRAFAEALAGSDTVLSVGIGPAGTGKTTAAAVVADAAHRAGVQVHALATAARTAADLGSGIGADTTMTLASWIHSGAADMVLGAGDIIIVDEAAMSSTFDLDRVVTDAKTAGAQVVALGDDRQLGPVGAGGAISLIASHTRVAQLSTAHRFASPDEADASLRLREGDATWYVDQGRVHGGCRTDMISQVVKAWAADRFTHVRDCLMIADTNADVAALNTAAQTWLLEVGLLTAGRRTVAAADEASVGQGDIVVTRANNRSLVASDGTIVKNRMRWSVLDVTAAGGLVVKNTAGARAVLPADYVARHVELGYAVTNHGAQGVTVDTAHYLTAATGDRSAAYPALTRGRLDNQVWVTDTTSDVEAAAMFTTMAERAPAASSAHQIIDQQWEAAERPADLVRAMRDMANSYDALRYTIACQQAGLSLQTITNKGEIYEQLRAGESVGLSTTRLARLTLDDLNGVHTDGCDGHIIAAIMAGHIAQARHIPDAAHRPLDGLTDDQLADYLASQTGHVYDLQQQMGRHMAAAAADPQPITLPDGQVRPSWAERHLGDLDQTSLDTRVEATRRRLDGYTALIDAAGHDLDDARHQWSAVNQPGQRRSPEAVDAALGVDAARRRLDELTGRRDATRRDLDALAAEQQLRAAMNPADRATEDAGRAVHAGHDRRTIIAGRAAHAQAVETLPDMLAQARTFADMARQETDIRGHLADLPVADRPRWDHYTPIADDPYLPEQHRDTLHQWQGFLDRRMRQAGAALALDENRPAWTQTLGPIPDDPDLRRRWETLAGRIDAYRDLTGYTHPRRPLPPPAQAETALPTHTPTDLHTLHAQLADLKMTIATGGHPDDPQARRAAARRAAIERATAPRQSVSRPAVMAGRQPHSYRSHAPQPSRRDQGQGRRRTR